MCEKYSINLNKLENDIKVNNEFLETKALLDKIKNQLSSKKIYKKILNNIREQEFKDWIKKCQLKTKKFIKHWKNKNMTNYQKIAKYIIENYNEGEVLSYKKITDVIYRECGINKDSILPSDYCDNHNNRDPHAGKYHIFHKISHGQYKV